MPVMPRWTLATCGRTEGIGMLSATPWMWPGFKQLASALPKASNTLGCSTYVAAPSKQRAQWTTFVLLLLIALCAS